MLLLYYLNAAAYLANLCNDSELEQCSVSEIVLEGTSRLRGHVQRCSMSTWAHLTQYTSISQTIYKYHGISSNGFYLNNSTILIGLVV